MAIYIEWEGIEGNVTAEGYAKHLAVDSFQFGVSRGISMETGNAVNRESTKPNYSEVVVSKPVDNSCTAIFAEASYGSVGKKLVIKFVQTGTDKVDEYMSYTLENCLVSSYSISGSAEGIPYESICISYTSIEVNYSDFDATNAQASPQRVGYAIDKAMKK